LGFQMQTMCSPDDPFFMLHHSNIDRLFALWQDCWDYELVDPNAITIQYQALNPISGTVKKVNPYNTSQAYDVGIDTPMGYFWKSYSSGKSQINQDTFIFPQANWPTPRNVHFIGNSTTNGWGGMNYVYGTDNIVSLIQQLSSTSTFCPKNTEWRLVNVDCDSLTTNPTKRDISGKKDKKKDRRSDNEKNIEGSIKNKWEEFKKGKNENDAWKQMVDWECQNSPQVELNEWFEAWLNMTGLGPELWDRGCDCVSDKWNKKHGKGQGKDKDNGKGQDKNNDKDFGQDIDGLNQHKHSNQQQHSGQRQHTGQHQHTGQRQRTGQHQHGRNGAHRNQATRQPIPSKPK